MMNDVHNVKDIKYNKIGKMSKSLKNKTLVTYLSLLLISCLVTPLSTTHTPNNSKCSLIQQPCCKCYLHGGYYVWFSFSLIKFSYSHCQRGETSILHSSILPFK